MSKVSLAFLAISLFARLLLRSDQSTGLQHDSLKPHRVLLLTAHPDDEAFFFGPTVTSLTSQAEIYSLCLSTGDADGEGKTRMEELSDSLEVLGVDQDKHWVLDIEGLKDNFTARWDAKLIADTVRPYILEHHITTILTFDPVGVSSHPNHLSLFHGTSYLLGSLPSPPRAYALISVPLSIKYTGPLAPALAKLDLNFSRALAYFNMQPSLSAHPISVYVSGVRQWARALRALSCHHSQLVWFRWLYMAFSRYMWVNEWYEIPAILSSSKV
ncbi:N-acetylglucosaminylphosphatidylinositoldeacety la se [Amylostereum chailletii]|nr:N-acetylglucosaminylphosphatidylinositoldeacety la se [Amylostereum chailletii]